MRYVVDHSVLLAIVRGDVATVFRLQMYEKRLVRVPEPVLLHVDREVARRASSGAKERWRLLAPALPRMPWTQDVTEMLMVLEPPLSFAVSLDAIIAAHAMATEGAVMTLERARFDGMPGVRVEDLLA